MLNLMTRGNKKIICAPLSELVTVGTALILSSKTEIRRDF